jgi:hypothetical protein
VIGWCGHGAQAAQLGDAVKAAEEEAGVQDAGDGRGGVDGGDDRDAEDVGAAEAGQGTSRLPDEDHPVEPGRRYGQKARQGDVAGPARHRTSGGCPET